MGNRVPNQICKNITGSATSVTLSGDADVISMSCSVAAKVSIGTAVVGSGSGQNYFLLPAGIPWKVSPGANTLLSAMRVSGTAAVAFTVFEEWL